MVAAGRAPAVARRALVARGLTRQPVAPLLLEALLLVVPPLLLVPRPRQVSAAARCRRLSPAEALVRALRRPLRAGAVAV